MSNILLKGVRVHNLKNIDVSIPKNTFTVITGLSGSGKSSLAFDTIYAEGQRRYVESLSSYARQFLGNLSKPDADSILGLSPTVAIDQHSVSHNPRSTVGTITEIYDHFRLLYARVGHVHCPECGQQIQKQSPTAITKDISSLLSQNKEAVLIIPIIREKKGSHKKTISELQKGKYKEVRINGDEYDIEDALDYAFLKKEKYTIDVLIRKYNGMYIKDLDVADLEELVKMALDLGDGVISLGHLNDGGEKLFSQYHICLDCNVSLPVIDPRSFSFNSPQGACPSCSGLGIRLTLDESLVIPNPKLSIAQGGIRPWVKVFNNSGGIQKELEALAARHAFDLNTPVGELSTKQFDALMKGDSQFQGIIAILDEKYISTTSDYVKKELEKYMRVQTCTTCDGKRLRKEILAVTIGGWSIADVVMKPIRKLLEQMDHFQNKKGDDVLTSQEREIAEALLREIEIRLNNIINVGLDYLTLDRSANTLSGGEAQRIRLATQLGSMLTGVVYVLDEPSIGLHPRDTDKLISTLKQLKDLENTVIVVEHDEATIQAADHIIDMGPGAGKFGGEIISSGSYKDILKDKKSITGAYLSGRKKIDAPAEYRKGNGKFINVKGAREFNLKNVSVEVPLGKFVCFTGVSGSGKSTLLIDILARSLSNKLYRSKDIPGEHDSIEGLEQVDKVIHIDQAPIGRTPRSNPATYTGVFTYIRDLFVEVPEARIKGYTPGHFSFNVKGGGRCEACQGEGYVKIDMQFLQDVFVKCEECHGRRYNKAALEVYYRGKNIADVLEMTVSEASEFFADVQIISEKLSTLADVGLGYLQLGQSATTLSGGEAQRIKLATELSRRETGKTIYILDEPTTGLHFDDVKKLLVVMQKLVDKGNSILVIEHNLDVIKSCDWIIDMGPEGGDKGGNVVAAGTPKDIAKVKESYTGQYLKKIL